MIPSTASAVNITASDRLGFTLFIALAIHIILILGITFTQTKAQQDRSLPSLDIILSQTQSLTTPEKYDFLAQNDQQGGGKSDFKARPSAPVSANTPIDQQGFSAKQQDAQLENTQELSGKKILTQQDSQRADKSSDSQKESISPTKQQKTQPQLRIAKLQAEIRKMREEYAKRPKQIVLSAATKKAVEASYLSQWVNRIERIGNLNYPQNALQQNISGALRLNVTINKLGKVIKISVSKSSGSSILDAAAKRIVNLAQPFQPFSEELQKSADQIVIIRTWEFSSKNQNLSTSG